MMSLIQSESSTTTRTMSLDSVTLSRMTVRLREREVVLVDTALGPPRMMN
jgi:hypothetical protein